MSVKTIMNQPIILLYGMPRSGTTWIGKIFDSHTKTLYRHEPDTWNKIKQIPLLESVENTQKHSNFLNEYVHDFINSRQPEVNGKLPFFDKSYQSFIRKNLFRGSVVFSSIVSKLKANTRLRVISPINIDKQSDYIVVWKSIQLLGRMGVIENCLENCKGVHILRHPCGYIASVLNGESKRKFSSYTPASEDYDLYEMLMSTEQAQTYNINMKKIKALSAEERLAWRWVLFNEKAMDDTSTENVKILKYEDMCSSPVNTAKQIFEFCELEWCEQTEIFVSASTSKDSKSYYSVFKNPEKAANKWRGTLTAEKIKQVEGIVMQSKVGSLYQGTF